MGNRETPAETNALPATTETILDRPAHNSAPALAIAVETLLPEVLGWLFEDEDKEPDDKDKDDVRDQLKHAMRWNKTDGYAIARDLEDAHGWQPDAALVEILEGASFALHNAHEHLVREWVKAQGITPKFAVGDAVVFRDRAARSRELIRYEGEIVRVAEDLAEYTVCVPALGHVRAGAGTQGRILPYEDVQAPE